MFYETVAPTSCGYGQQGQHMSVKATRLASAHAGHCVLDGFQVHTVLAGGVIFKVF